jgi:hypothetical protein
MKKAMISFEMVYWIARVIFLVVVIVSVVFLTRLYITGHTDTQELEKIMIVNHFLYSPSLLYFDEFTGRAMLGIIDLKKLDNTLLDSSFNFSEQNKMAAVNITINDLQDKMAGKAFYKKDDYDNFLPLVGEGAGSVSRYDFKAYTLYYSGGKINPGTINMIVLIPRS